MYHLRSFFESMRQNKTVQKGLTILYASMMALSLVSCSSQIDGALTQRQYRAFTYMQVETNVVIAYGCINSEKDKCTFVAAQPYRSNASGVVVMNSKTRKGRQYVMTAAHVCESVLTYESNIKSLLKKSNNFIVDKLMYTSSLKIQNSTGQTYDGKVVTLWTDRDLCVVAVDGMKTLPVAIAEKQVTKGSKVWNLAAPLGVWQPKLQSKFEGYYAGVYVCEEESRDTFPIGCQLGEDTWSVFNMPAAPGSSGSPIFNEQGQLIGIVSMVPMRFQHIAYATRLEDIQRVLSVVRQWDAKNIDVDFDSDTVRHPEVIEIK